MLKIFGNFQPNYAFKRYAYKKEDIHHVFILGYVPGFAILTITHGSKVMTKLQQ